MPNTVAVIGCGLIGVSWAALFSAHGYTVQLWDAAEDWKSRIAGPMEAARAQLSDLGSCGTGQIVAADSLADAVRSADWVQENVPESLEVKRETFARICAYIRPSTILASSTSSLTWAQLAPLVDLPNRLVTAHPFNPPHLMPLVEVYASDDRTAATAMGFYRSLGRRPIRLRRPVTGHIANRLASALWREAVHLVAEGIADVEDIDVAMTEGPGLRWSIVGPHMAYHLGGGAGGMRHYLAHLGDSQVRRWADLGTPVLSQDVRERLADGVEREAAGRSIDELAQERDRMLIGTLKLRRQPE